MTDQVVLRLKNIVGFAVSQDYMGSAHNQILTSICTWSKCSQMLQITSCLRLPFKWQMKLCNLILIFLILHVCCLVALLWYQFSHFYSAISGFLNVLCAQICSGGGFSEWFTLDIIATRNLKTGRKSLLHLLYARMMDAIHAVWLKTTSRKGR